jgi:DNA mismatch endonuclease (patch repair protein)
MRRNQERDRRASSLAVDLGYQVIRVWECQVRDDLEGAAATVLEACLA